MVRDKHSHETTGGRDDILARIEEAVAGAGPADVKDTLARLLASGMSGMDPFERPTPPSRRRPRRPDVVTYRVRVDLKWTKPPLWRRLELASDLSLDDVHDIIQAAFGWTDTHLHRFGSGPEYYSVDTEYYLCPFEVEEGEVGVPEDEVRLDEVLVDVGDKLFYAYDFGDDWHHTIKLEAVLPREDPAPRAVCTAGRRDGPAEDCGGAGGYELIAAATDPTRQDHAEAAAEFARVYGDDVDSGVFHTTPFDIEEINDALAGLGLDGAGSESELPPPLEELVHAVRTTTEGRRLRRLVEAAAPATPVRVDAETATRMVGPYAWLLDRVGPDGIELTGAGYLPPTHVEAAVAEFGLGQEWIGKGNRENQTMPVLHLRESAQTMGLLRRYRGRLALTARGRALRTDPVALWWHLATRMPPASKDACERQAGLILLVAVAAQTTDDLDAIVAGTLDAIGWMAGDGTPLTPSMASLAAWDTRAVLRRLGGFVHDRSYRSARPTPEGVTFARAALRTWPAG